MNNLAFLSMLRSQGIRLWLDGESLRVKAGAGVLTNDLKRQLAERKVEIVAFLRQSQLQEDATASLLGKLRQLGIKLWMEEDKLRIKAAAGVLTPELKRDLAEHKPRILALLSQAQKHPSPSEEARTYALLNDHEKRLWALHQLISEPGAHHVSLALSLRGSLEHKRLHHTLEALLRRHPSLRVAFRNEEGKPKRVHRDDAKPLITFLSLPPGSGDLAEAIARETGRPFDLEQSPLLRLSVFDVSRDHQVLLFVLHRIVADRFSLGPLLEDFSSIYDAKLHEAEEKLIPLEEKYQTYEHWRRHFHESKPYLDQVTWWSHRLDGWSLSFELPTDTPRGRTLSCPGVSHPIALSPATLAQLREYAQDSGSSAADILFAAYCVLLHRYSGRDHFLVARPSQGNQHFDHKHLIGRFFNVLPTRVNCLGQPSFTDLSERLAAEASASQGQQDVLLTHLSEELQQEPSISQNPVCQVLFIARKTTPQHFSLAGIEVNTLPVPSRSAFFELTLNLEEQDSALGLEFEYNSELFQAATLLRMEDHFLRLLEGCLTQPNTPITQLAILSESEQRMLLHDWNATVEALPHDLCLHELVLEQLRLDPDRMPLTGSDNQSISYRQLDDLSNRMANFLREQGVGEGKYVGIHAPLNIQTSIALLAVLKLGGVYVPLYPRQPKSRIEFILQDTGAGIVLTLQSLLGEIPSFVEAVICLDSQWSTIETSANTPQTARVQPHQSAYVIYTPMSTGMPKAVVATHRAVANRLHWLQRNFPLDPQDRILQRTPLTSGTAANELYWGLFAGAHVTLPPEDRVLNYIDLAQVITEQKITIIHIVPYALEKLLQEPLVAECSSLRRVFCGAEPLPLALVKRFFAHMPKTELINLYGSTEAGGEITAWRCNIDDIHPIAPIGRPIANTYVYILDQHTMPVPVGVPGEIYVAGMGLSNGYLNRPAFTQERFLPNPFASSDHKAFFKTGDLGRYLPDGNIEILGRTDLQVKVRGVRVDLEEIEYALMGHPAISSCACVFRRDAFGEPRLVAYYCTKDAVSISTTTLQEHLEKTLPQDIVPSLFLRSESLPVTSEGHLDRSQLPVPEEFQRQRRAFPRAYSDVERAIAAAWRKVLKTSNVDFEDNFFDLGGDSLQMLEVYHHLPETLKHGLDPTHLFQFPTIHSLGAYLEKEQEDSITEPRREDAQASIEKLIEKSQSEPGLKIAVIGWSGRFPGAANPSELWQALQSGQVAISQYTREELLEEGMDEELLDDPYYVRARAGLTGLDLFDAAFFGLTSREAKLTDPQQRILLECVHEAIENAGYALDKTQAQVGLFAGIGPNHYYPSFVHKHPKVTEYVDGFAIQIGNQSDFVCTRIAHLMGLDGPARSIQAGASSSFLAVSSAAEALLAGECSLAVAGGIHLGDVRKSGYMQRLEGYWSSDGHCRPFDLEAKGQVPGQGCALVVLKTLDQAIREGDTIRGVLRAMSSASGGAGAMGVPCEKTWIRTIEASFNNLDFGPEAISFIEGAGLGQPAIDALELRCLEQVYPDQPGRIALGSTKGNLGSLEHAAFVTALIKVCKVVEQGVLPPHPASKPIPMRSSFFLNAKPGVIPASGQPRRAALNLFEPGGYYGHALVEQPPPIIAVQRQRPWHLLTLSAKNNEALDKMTQDLIAHLKSRAQLDFSDVSYTLNLGRADHRYRRMVVAQGLHEAILELEKHNPERVFSRHSLPHKRPVAFMFPGQGVQYQNMGRQLYLVEPTYRAEVDLCWSIIHRNAPELYENLTQHDRGSRSEKLHQTYVTQPATFITEYALAKLLIKWGIAPDCMIGNSLGEFVSATLAGVFSLEDALNIVCSRGRLMQGLPEGRQLAVSLSEQEVLSLLNQELSIAGVAGPKQTMVAGSKQAIDGLKKHLDQNQITCYRLFTSHAFHSFMMDPIMSAFEQTVAQVNLHPPKIPFISTITGTWITDADAMDPSYWARQLRLPVRFAQGLEVMFNLHKDLLVLEVGPDKQLSTIAIRHPAKNKDQLVFATMRQPMEEESDCHHMLTTLGRLWLHGFPIDWHGFHSERRNRRVQLPTYPFERKRHWMDHPSEWEMAAEEENESFAGDSAIDHEDEHFRGNISTDFVAPRDKVEQEIASYWCQALGLAEVGIYDDFFESGGSSLIAVRLVNQLRRKLRVPLANPILLQKRNIAAFSDYIKEIRALGSGAGDQGSIIVQLQRGERGTTPIFLFHPIEGDILIYRQLVDYLGPKQPVYAVQARSLVGGEPFSDIPTQATAYLEDIRKLQPNGPYLIAGFSYGGFLAYEISRLLLMAKEKVGLTAMIDSSHPSRIQMNYQSPVEILKFLTGYVIDFPEEEYLGLSHEEQIAYAESRIRAANRASLIPPVFGLEMCRTWMGHQTAIANYNPKPFPGRVIFFNATELMGDANAGGYYPWLELVQGGMELHHVPGHHISIMNFPDQVKIIARHLKRALRQV